MGFAAFVLLIPLAVTSTNGAVKRLGFRRWKQVHRLAYIVPTLAVVHFVWRVKKDLREPATYAVILTALLTIRMAVSVRAWLAAHADRETPARRPTSNPHGAVT